MSAESNARFTLAQRVALAVVPRVVAGLLRVVAWTWRYDVIAEPGVTAVRIGEAPGAGIYCFWHQCVLPCTVYFRFSRAVILISRSFDGELVTRVLRRFGFDAVRGSSSRAGREGLLGLKRVVEAGLPAIFTADGPRGPIYETKMGPVKLAEMTGQRIGSFHLQPERAWVMRSWDRFLVPKPFTRIVVSWGPWTEVPHRLDPEEFEAKRQELNANLELARLRAAEHLRARR